MPTTPPGQPLPPYLPGFVQAGNAPDGHNPDENNFIPDSLWGFAPPAVLGGKPRSSHWPTVRAHFLSEHKTCEACGSKHDLQVHHEVPYHEAPERELDPTNLITVCGPCHFVLCHANNWSNWVRDARKRAATHLALVTALRAERGGHGD